MAKIQGKFNWNKPEVYTSFVQGADAQAIYNSLKGSMVNEISYDLQSKTLIGSNVFAAAKIDSILKPLRIRVANLRDLSRPEVMAMIRDKHYTDTPALILRSTKDDYSKNIPIINQLIQAVEKTNGQLQLPVMVTGFNVKVGKEKEGYGIVIVPRDDFKAISDSRLSGKYNTKKFSEIDESGLPKFDSNGSRVWYAKPNGLSRLYLDRNLDLDSGDDDLAYSDGDGRVVLVSAVGDTKNLESKL